MADDAPILLNRAGRELSDELHDTETRLAQAEAALRDAIEAHDRKSRLLEAVRETNQTLRASLTAQAERIAAFTEFVNTVRQPATATKTFESITNGLKTLHDRLAALASSSR